MGDDARYMVEHKGGTATARGATDGDQIMAKFEYITGDQTSSQHHILTVKVDRLALDGLTYWFRSGDTTLPSDAVAAARAMDGLNWQRPVTEAMTDAFEDLLAVLARCHAPV